MDPIDKARLERIEKAVEGRDLNGYTEVKPEDVAALAALVKDQSEGVQGLVKAAGNNRPGAEGVHFRTDQLAHLVEQVRPKQGPKPKKEE